MISLEVFQLYFLLFEANPILPVYTMALYRRKMMCLILFLKPLWMLFNNLLNMQIISKLLANDLRNNHQFQVPYYNEI